MLLLEDCWPAISCCCLHNPMVVHVHFQRRSCASVPHRVAFSLQPLLLGVTSPEWRRLDCSRWSTVLWSTMRKRCRQPCQPYATLPAAWWRAVLLVDGHGYWASAYPLAAHPLVWCLMGCAGYDTVGLCHGAPCFCGGDGVLPSGWCRWHCDAAGTCLGLSRWRLRGTSEGYVDIGGRS